MWLPGAAKPAHVVQIRAPQTKSTLKSEDSVLTIEAQVSAPCLSAGWTATAQVGSGKQRRLCLTAQAVEICELFSFPPFCFPTVLCLLICLFVGSQQYASVSQGRMCSDNCTCCHTETEAADQTFHLTHSILTPGQPAPALTL